MSNKKKKPINKETAVMQLPAEKNITVVTFDGTIAEKSKCRRIKDDYYIVGDIKIKDSGQVYKIGETYYRENLGKIAWDYEVKQYVLVSGSLANGIVDVKPNGDPIFGYFTRNKFNNIDVYRYEDSRNDIKLCINEQTAMKLKGASKDVIIPAIVYTNTGINLKGLSNPGVHNKSKIPGFDLNLYSFNGNPAIDTAIDNFATYVEDSGEFKILPFIEKLAPFLKEYSFGFEFETCSGTLPLKELYRNGLIPVKDGSISGHEYVSIPHTGAIGLQAIYNSCEALSKWCKVDKNCSMHIHVGNVPRDKKFIIAFYMLCYQLQMELHECVAPYKKDVHYLASKPGGAKDHCKHLSSLGLFQNTIYTAGKFDKDLESNFQKIFTWLNDGRPADRTFSYETRTHVKNGRPKWEIESRYYWINLWNLIFSNNETIENRLHSGTLNATKSINWLIITIALIEFAKNNAEEIIRAKTKYKLEDIFENVFKGQDYANLLIEYINEYILSRKANHLKLLMNHHDYIGDEFDNGDTHFRPIDKIKL